MWSAHGSKSLLLLLQALKQKMAMKMGNIRLKIFFVIFMFATPPFQLFKTFCSIHNLE